MQLHIPMVEIPVLPAAHAPHEVSILNNSKHCKMMKWTRAPKKEQLYSPVWYTITGSFGFYLLINIHLLLWFFSKSWFLTFVFIGSGVYASLFYFSWLPRLEIKFFERKLMKKQIMYHDIWETQINTVSPSYYTYYVYIWQNWHEMEERIIYILLLRNLFCGL